MKSKMAQDNKFQFSWGISHVHDLRLGDLPILVQANHGWE